MESKSKFKIYRLCRNQETIERFESEGAKYNLPEQILATGPDYFTFIEDIIKSCKEDYALLCHDDIVVPLDIAERVKECIAKVDDFCGEDSWGVVGNAGIEAISLKTVRFLKDPHTAVVPYRSRPIPVVSVDGNTMLLNIKNMRKNKVEMPKDVRGFHMYDFITLVECYRQGLLAFVDSSLYVYHSSGGVQKGFDDFTRGEKFQSYWKRKFVNHKIYTINGPVEINKPDLGYLKENSSDKRADFYAIVKKLILSIEKTKKKPTLNIITRTQLRNLDALRRLLESVSLSQGMTIDSLNIRMFIAANNLESAKSLPDAEALTQEFSNLNVELFVCSPEAAMAPRLYSIKAAVAKVPVGDDQFVWIVDDDDFIFPRELKLLSKYLAQDTIFVGKSESFDEEWEIGREYPLKSAVKPDFYCEETYEGNYLGDNHVPICSAIIPGGVLRSVFTDYKLAGDYYEDYALLFLSQVKCNIQYLPILIAGVSHHGQNTVFEKDRTHWDYSYTTFLSEMTNAGVVNNSVFELNSTLDNYSRNYQSGKFLMGLAFGKIKTILSLVFRLKIRTLINLIRSYL